MFPERIRESEAGKLIRDVLNTALWSLSGSIALGAKELDVDDGRLVQASGLFDGLASLYEALGGMVPAELREGSTAKSCDALAKIIEDTLEQRESANAN